MPTFGPQPYGVGTPAVASAQSGLILVDPTSGRQQGAKRINPLTRDYVHNAQGRATGMSATASLVYMAVATAYGSSAVRELGHELAKIGRITSNLQHQVESTLRSAVQHIVDRGLILVLGVIVTKLRPGVVLFRMQWRDLETGDREETATENGV